VDDTYLDTQGDTVAWRTDRDGIPRARLQGGWLADVCVEGEDISLEDHEEAGVNTDQDECHNWSSFAAVGTGAVAEGGNNVLERDTLPGDWSVFLVDYLRNVAQIAVVAVAAADSQPLSTRCMIPNAENPAAMMTVMM
jgi:hypothetical protein